MSSAVRSTSRSVARRTYTASRDGTYHIARMREDLLGAGSEYGIGCGGDLDRDGDVRDFFAMLWRDSDNKVWSTPTDDLSFADELVDDRLQVNYDIGHFGTDNPATPVQRVAAVRCADRPAGRKRSSTSASSPARTARTWPGIAAGNSLFGGR